MFGWEDSDFMIGSRVSGRFKIRPTFYDRQFSM